MIPIYVGYDPREPVAYATFCDSVIRHASQPVAFIPLALNVLRGQYEESHGDGSNDFIYSRFLVPHLTGFSGWAIYADGDMVVKDDIAKLWALRDNHNTGVMVAKHNYRTLAGSKYLGAKNEDYPRKNWSSLILWNCVHFGNRVLTPEHVAKASGADLHRFTHLKDEQIGELPLEWNWLAEEYRHNDHAKLIHYTLGTPCFPEYHGCDHAEDWHLAREAMNSCA